MSDRYARQRLIKGWDQCVLDKAHVLVVGAGTTGNEVIKNLALLGVGEMTIFDFDAVEEVNLSRSVLFRAADFGKSKAKRAAHQAKQLNPHARSYTGFDRDIIYDAGNVSLARYDAVITTVDNIEARMWTNRYCGMSSTPLIDTGVAGLRGNVSVVTPPASPCLECAWDQGVYDRLADRFSCLKLGLAPEATPAIPMVITTAAIVAGLATQELVRLLHERCEGAPSRGGVFLTYEGESGTVQKWRIAKRERCPGHPPSDMPDVLGERVSLRTSVAKLRRDIIRRTGATTVEIGTDKELVYSSVCRTCGNHHRGHPVWLGQYRRELCTFCGAFEVVPDGVSHLLQDGMTLTTLGIPAAHRLDVWFEVDGAVEHGMVTTAG